MPTYGGGLTAITLAPSPPAALSLADRLLWRWLVTDLEGAAITLMDHLASDRQVTRKLVLPSEMTGTVPSDSPEINILHTDGDPFLSEGNRLLYGFRRESGTDPYWVIRASGVIMQVEDTTQTDIATTRFTAYDPWQYLYSLPVLRSVNATDKYGKFFTNATAGKLLPAEGIYYPVGMRADQILMDILETTLAYVFDDATLGVPLGAQYAFTNRIDGVIQQCASFPPTSEDTGGYQIQQGKSVGQAWADIVATGTCDIVFEPFYDPANWPGILSLLNIYKGPKGASSVTPIADDNGYNGGAVFAWDRPGRNLSSVNRLQDGSQRANEIMPFNSGTPVFNPDFPGRPFYDPASIAKFGPYWAQQFYTDLPSGKAGRAALAALIGGDQGAGWRGGMLDLRKNRKTTVTVSPVPEYSPEPFIDYNLGDRVPIYAGLDLNAAGTPNSPHADRLPNSIPNQFREELVGWQRIVEIPIDIDDNGNETVRQLVVGPAAEPPPVETTQSGSGPTSTDVAIGTARRTNRGGFATSFGGRS